jgi:hypothetical protein
LHIHGIKEMPAGYDAEVAELFRDLRSASGLSEADLATQLATRLEVVQALEQGAIHALPPWPETFRVISTYGTLLNLDVRPLLRRIYAQVEAGIVQLAPKPMPDVPVMPSPQDGFRETPRQPAQRLSEPFPAQPAKAPAPAPQAAQRRAPPQAGPPQPQRPPQSPQPQRSLPPGQPPRGIAPPMQTGPQPAPRGIQVRPRQQLEQKALPKPGQPQTQASAPAPNPPPPPPKPRGAKANAPKAAAAPAPAKKPGRGLLRWAIVLLLASAAAFGLWMWFSQSGLFGLLGPSAESGKEHPPAASTDPNDPRSRKADRLPGPPS